MRIWRSLDEVPDALDRTVVTIGNFDGVHRGHQHVAGRARQVADQREARLVAVTFDPHPMAVLRPEHAPQQLTGLETRARLLGEAGVDDVLVLPFSLEMAAWSPEEFIERVLVDALHASAVVVGANFRFGARAGGDVSTLAGYGGFDVEGVALDGGPQVWSSTYVRTCLAAGDVEGAAEALGRPYSVVGVVVEGDKRGRELGFPTANVPPGDSAAPADGVYAGRLRILDHDGPVGPVSAVAAVGAGGADDAGGADGADGADGAGREGGAGTAMPAAISVGTNPTFDGQRDPRVEAYVLDRTDLELYGVRVEVSFLARIRGMVRFETVEGLVAEMHRDVERTRELLGR